MSRPAAYDMIGVGYSARRRSDPRIAVQIVRALGDAVRILTVGGGTGSYEPADRRVVAVEPSDVMLEQRATDAAPAARAVAEALPFPDDAFDAVMGVLTVHHWRDLDAGLAEMRRVAPRRVVLVFDQERAADVWPWREYFPAANVLEAGRAPRVERVVEGLDADRVEVVPVPHDCTDGFGGAYWRRPEAYLDPGVRAGISSLAAMPDDVLRPGLDRLAADLASGAWAERHADLLALDEIDLGYRLVIAD
jgi:SAM-dependent methyltransferase